MPDLAARARVWYYFIQFRVDLNVGGSVTTIRVVAMSARTAWTRRFLLFVSALGGGLALFSLGRGLAQDYPTEPLLRLEAGTHTAGIMRIALDRQGRFLVSGSFDKTVRFWDVESGRLLQTLRVPVAAGNVGKVYAVAISPNGATVAAGGWTDLTGRSWNIYLFDRATGRLMLRIAELPSVVNHLAYAPDGQFLVATLGGQNGIRVYETRGYTEVGKDTNYEGGSFWADFDTRP